MHKTAKWSRGSIRTGFEGEKVGSEKTDKGRDQSVPACSLALGKPLLYSTCYLLYRCRGSTCTGQWQGWLCVTLLPPLPSIVGPHFLRLPKFSNVHPRVLSFWHPAARLLSPLLTKMLQATWQALCHQMEGPLPSFVFLDQSYRESCKNAHPSATSCAPSWMRQYPMRVSCLSFLTLLWNFSPPVPRLCPTLSSPLESSLTTSTQIPFFQWHTLSSPQLLWAFLVGCLLSSLGFPASLAVRPIARSLWLIPLTVSPPPALGHSSSRSWSLLSSQHTDSSL